MARKIKEGYNSINYSDEEEYKQVYKVDPKTGIPLKDENGRPIPRSFADDLEDIKKKLAAFGSNVKAAALEFLSGGKPQYNFNEETDFVVTDEDPYEKKNEIPQTKEEVIEKAKEIREQIDSIMENLATMQVYCAANTKDRQTTSFVRELDDSLQTTIDSLECMINGDCDCKCDEPKDVEIEDPEDPLIEVTEDEDD